MLGLRMANRRCYGCGNRIKEEGISLLSSPEMEHCYRCSGFITRRGVIGHLIREKRELQEAYASLQAFNEQLQCALNRKKEALTQAQEEMEAFLELRSSAVTVGCNTDPEPAPTVGRNVSGAAASEYVDRLLQRSVSESSSALLVSQPSTVSPMPVYGFLPKCTNAPVPPMASPDSVSSPCARTKMWLEETARGTVPPRSDKRASLAPEESPSVELETSWVHPESERQSDLQTPRTLADLVTPRTLFSPVAQAEPQSLRRASDFAYQRLAAATTQLAEPKGQADLDNIQLSVPATISPTAQSASARGTNYTAFTQLNGLESRASMSDRGSEHSYSSSRPSSSVLSHPMQTLRQSRNVRSAIADDISYVDELIKAYKKTPKKDAKESPSPLPG